MTYPWPTLMPMGIVVISCVRPSNHPWAWVCVLHTKRLEEMAYNLACWCIQMAYTQHSWMLMDIVVGLSVHPSVHLGFLAATKQLYDWFSPSVRPSVCPSVTPFSPCSHHRIIMKFSGVITIDKSDVHAKGQGQRSKVKVTEVNTQLNRFRTVTPVWIHIWWWNHA